jgi:hypothetical protein
MNPSNTDNVITEMDVFESAKVKNTTPSSGTSDSEREYSWSHVDVEDKKTEEPKEEPKVEPKQEPKVEVKEEPKEEVKQEQKQEATTVQTDSSDDDMPPLVEDSDDDDMPSLVSERADQLMMAFFTKPNCERCEAALKVLMGHTDNSPENSDIELSEHETSDEDSDSDSDSDEDEEKESGVPTIIGGLFIIYLILQIADLIQRLSGQSSIQYCRPL